MPAVSRKADVWEALAMFVIIMAYIWKFRFTHPRFWLVAIALIVVSHLVRHERVRSLGFHTQDFGTCMRRFGPALIGLAVALFGVGLLLGTIRPLGYEHALGAFALYLPWGLFQQYLLNGYFLKRFEMTLAPTAAGVLTAMLFCAVHTPNWFLMLVTLVGGYGAVWVYQRHKNLYFLGLAHAVIGTLLFMVVPDSVSHRLRVGPGWFAPTVAAQAVGLQSRELKP